MTQRRDPKRKRDGTWVLDPVQATPPRWRNPWDRRPPGTKADEHRNERSAARGRALGELLPESLKPGRRIAQGLARILGS